jgi:hypothetical protein
MTERSLWSDLTALCHGAVRSFHVAPLDADTYVFEDDQGEVSLVNYETLVEMIRSLMA